MITQTSNNASIQNKHEFMNAEMDIAEIRQWITLLNERTGITLPESRRSFLVSNLNIRMRELGITSYQAYYDYLMSGYLGDIEWITLVDRLTVHETRFFRDQQSIGLVRDMYLEQLQPSPESKTSIDIWSVGCSTGEEAYSLAIEIDDYLSQSGKQYYYSVTGSDISMAVILSARKAIYKNNHLQNVSERLLAKYFEKQSDSSYQVKDLIRKRVCFGQLNIMDLEKSKVGAMDIIFCQNVLIYFKREQRLKILDDLVNHMKPGGLLVLGAGEIHSWNNPYLENVSRQGVLSFRRTGF